MVKAYYF